MIFMAFLVLVMLVMNAAAFVLMAVDKDRARRGQWRIPEKTLFLVTALFGGLGGTLGMYLCRHKTQHMQFRIGFPVLLGVQTVIFLLLAIILL